MPSTELILTLLESLHETYLRIVTRLSLVAQESCFWSHYNSNNIAMNAWTII